MKVYEVAQLDPEEQYWQNPNPDTINTLKRIIDLFTLTVSIITLLSLLR